MHHLDESDANTVKKEVMKKRLSMWGSFFQRIQEKSTDFDDKEADLEESSFEVFSTDPKFKSIEEEHSKVRKLLLQAHGISEDELSQVRNKNDDGNSGADSESDQDSGTDTEESCATNSDTDSSDDQDKLSSSKEVGSNNKGDLDSSLNWSSTKRESVQVAHLNSGVKLIKAVSKDSELSNVADIDKTCSPTVSYNRRNKRRSVGEEMAKAVLKPENSAYMEKDNERIDSIWKNLTNESKTEEIKENVLKTKSKHGEADNISHLMIENKDEHNSPRKLKCPEKVERVNYEKTNYEKTPRDALQGPQNPKGTRKDKNEKDLLPLTPLSTKPKTLKSKRSQSMDSQTLDLSKTTTTHQPHSSPQDFSWETLESKADIMDKYNQYELWKLQKRRQSGQRGSLHIVANLDEEPSEANKYVQVTSPVVIKPVLTPRRFSLQKPVLTPRRSSLQKPVFR